MFNISISSVEETKFIEKNFKKFLKEKEYLIYTGEGLSINQNGINLFERFEVDEKDFEKIIEGKLSNENFRDFLNYFINLIIDYKLYDKNHYLFIINLLKKHDITYNIIIHTNKCKYFLWITFKLYKEPYINIELINNCKTLSRNIFLITNKEENKIFNAKHHLKCIDKCLREENAPYPGNFDGLIYEERTLQPKFIIEYSKVNWVYKLNKDIKYHLKWYCEDKKETGWKRDINRWKSLIDLSNFIEIPVYIIWWGTEKEEFSVGQLKKIDQNNCYNSIDIIKEKITRTELFSFFEDLLNHL